MTSAEAPRQAPPTPEPAAAASAGALAYLRERRAPGRRAGRGNTAYTLYCVLLVTAVWGVPYLAAALRAAQDGSWQGPAADRVLHLLPVAGPVLCALLPLAAARRARWRGPVRVDPPTAAWLLPHPVARRALLLPSFRRAAALWGGAGAAAGAAAGLVLHALRPGPWWAALLAGACGGGAAGCLATAAGVVTQRHGGVPRTLPWAPPLAAVAALPLVAAAGGAPAWAGAAAAALATAGAAAALTAARRAAPAIPARVLREQAAAAVRLAAAGYALDLRLAAATVRAARGRAPVARRGPPPPRRGRPAALLLVPWRDATGLLREPSRLLWAALWWAAALACASLPHPAAALAALVAGCAGASQLAEPARLEGDDMRRSAALPWPPGSLALRHGLLPGALLLLTGLPAAVVLGGGAPLLLAGVPALVCAALVQSYRGAVPTRLLIGSETPLGNTGPVQVLLWAFRGPLAVSAALGPALVATASRGATPPAAWALAPAVGAAAAWWAQRTAYRLRSGPAGRTGARRGAWPGGRYPLASRRHGMGRSGPTAE
ncbi:DUF6297 family protein [Streptomyces hoynatensis]|uniref:Uncharacterized protein n=1 Tax=Streptomyces hoynatensis TaxID=1141874 RepID=A0A3A9Z9L4_9ACTN|nr:DUF6297 family protein [Streptomyces hoynatensis]RKN44980.1 hypothetical protein D7294_07725 [Streptomyces hoynatensis]